MSTESPTVPYLAVLHPKHLHLVVHPPPMDFPVRDLIHSNPHPLVVRNGRHPPGLLGDLTGDDWAGHVLSTIVVGHDPLGVDVGL